MKVTHLVLALLLLGLSGAVRLPGQPTDGGRKLLAELKARADKGDAEAQLALGSLYATGAGVAKDPAKAARWHRKAADQGLARAQYQVGLDYAEGDGVKPSKTEACRWYRKAADQGLVEAQLELGLCYANGEGVTENSVEAVQWFRKAADQGQARARYELGNCYLEGAGAAKDLVEGIKWIRQAAEQGYAPAQNTLGRCYQQGNGVTKDYVAAYEWFSLAAANDDEHAPDIRVNLAKVEAVLTPEQVAQAQRWTREFKPGQKTGATSVPASPAAGVLAGQTNAAPGAGAILDETKTGWVNVKADDESCEIFVDGAFVGNSPARLKLAEGAHVIEVKKAGLANYRREIKVSAGSDLTLRVVLQNGAPK